MTALINWVEKGKAPEKIIAIAFKNGDAKNGIRFQRPIFPYPKFPKYISGDFNVPSSFKAGQNKNSRFLAPADKYLR